MLAVSQHACEGGSMDRVMFSIKYVRPAPYLYLTGLCIPNNTTYCAICFLERCGSSALSRSLTASLLKSSFRKLHFTAVGAGLLLLHPLQGAGASREFMIFPAMTSGALGTLINFEISPCPAARPPKRWFMVGILSVPRGQFLTSAGVTKGRWSGIFSGLIKTGDGHSLMQTKREFVSIGFQITGKTRTRHVDDQLRLQFSQNVDANPGNEENYSLKEYLLNHKR